MKIVSILLGASLLANALFIGGYLSSKKAVEKERERSRAAEIAQEFDFSLEQRRTLRRMQRELRDELIQENKALEQLYGDVVSSMKESRLGDTEKLDTAIEKYGLFRAELVQKVAHHGLAFKERLDPDQQALFNETLDHPRFIFALAGIGGAKRKNFQQQQRQQLP